MAFHDPTLVKLGDILAARAVAIDAETAKLVQLAEPARIGALQEIASQFRELAKELGA
jgi:hypothetical protein